MPVVHGMLAMGEPRDGFALTAVENETHQIYDLIEAHKLQQQISWEAVYSYFMVPMVLIVSGFLSRMPRKMVMPK